MGRKKVWSERGGEKARSHISHYTYLLSQTHLISHTRTLQLLTLNQMVWFLKQEDLLILFSKLWDLDKVFLDSTAEEGSSWIRLWKQWLCCWASLAGWWLGFACPTVTGGRPRWMGASSPPLPSTRTCGCRVRRIRLGCTTAGSSPRCWLWVVWERKKDILQHFSHSKC